MDWQWHQPERQYRSYLQVNSMISMLIIGAVIFGLYWNEKLAQHLPASWIIWCIWGALTLFFTLFWAPRRYDLTFYGRSDEAVFLRRGALWRSRRAVPLNRIQHIEHKQSFLERLFGLARLAIYTAGSSGADLAIPGLKPDEALQMKHELLTTIANEPSMDDPNHD